MTRLGGIYGAVVAMAMWSCGGGNEADLFQANVGGAAGQAGAPSTGGQPPAVGGASGQTGGVGGTGQAGVGGTATGGVGGTGVGGTGGGPLTTEEQACEQLIQAQCNQVATCAPALFGSEWGNIDICMARQRLSCVLDMFAPGSSWAPDGIAGCAQAIAAASCTQPYWFNPPQECYFPLGTLSIGFGCGVHMQCATGYCRQEVNTTCGLCAPLSGSGGSCIENAGCETSYVCSSNTDTCVAGTTSVGLGLGEQCLGVNQCEYRLGLECDTLGSNTCVPYLLADPGQPCNKVPMPDQPRTTYCRYGATCVPTGPFGLVGTCVAAIPDGAPCNPDVACMTPAKCINGVCQVENPGLMCQ